MAIASTTNRAVYTADGSQTAFPFPYLFYDATHLAVYVSGVVQSTGYTVTGAGEDEGGTVTFATAPANNAQVLILRVVPLKQETVYGVAGAFPAKSHERALDLLTMIVQQLAEVDGRCIKLPPSSTLTEVNLPDPGSSANFGRGLRISASGGSIETFDIGSTPYSSVLTTKGDLATSNGSAQARLPVGADGEVLTPDSADALGIKWTTMRQGGAPPSGLIPYLASFPQPLTL